MHAHWRNKLRPRILARDGYVCQIKGPGCTGEATEVDHIVPWLEGGDWFNEANLRAACTHCNRARANKSRPKKTHPRDDRGRFAKGKTTITLPSSREW
jgi:5-methylcytosine-specific restriction endonuclease McrA